MNENTERSAIKKVDIKPQMSLQDAKKELKKKSKGELVSIIVNLASVVDLYKEKNKSVQDLVNKINAESGFSNYGDYSQIMDELNAPVTQQGDKDE